MEISGKKAVVVGGASGFGRASAELLAYRGASVAILDRDGSRRQGGRRRASAAPFIQVDVTDFEGTEKALARRGRRPRRPARRLTTAGGGVAERRSRRTARTAWRPSASTIDLNLIAQLQHQPPRRRHMSKNEPGTTRPRSAASSSTPHRSRRSRARSARSPTPRQGRHRRHVPDDGARPGQPGHPGAGDRAEPVRHRPDRRASPTSSPSALTKDAAFPKRLGKPEEYAKLALAIVENPMLNGQCLRLDAGQRFAPK